MIITIIKVAVVVVLNLWFIWKGVQFGYYMADQRWYEHLEEHGIKFVKDPNDEIGVGIPTRMYADCWYERRAKKELND